MVIESDIAAPVAGRAVMDTTRDFPRSGATTLTDFKPMPLCTTLPLIDQDMVEESPSLFPTNYVILARGKNKYKFSIVIGQGSAYITDKV